MDATLACSAGLWDAVHLHASVKDLCQLHTPRERLKPNPMAQGFELPTITHRLLTSSFLGLPSRILNINHKKELLRSLWVTLNPENPKTYGFRQSCWALLHSLDSPGVPFLSAKPEVGPGYSIPKPETQGTKGETLKGILGVIWGLYETIYGVYKGYVRVLGFGVPSRGPSYCPFINPKWKT